MRLIICLAKSPTIAWSSCEPLYDRRNAEEARRDLAAWLLRWQEKYPKLCAWVEENIEETLTFYRLPREHHKHLKSTNMLERLNQELKRRTHVIRIFPNEESCLRLIRALAVHRGDRLSSAELPATKDPRSRLPGLSPTWIG